tara:strand:- start:343 stop:510 length:168 start_codon:yes stop_codon:yes gene_type:complete
MNEDKRIIKIAFEVTDNFELQLEDIRKMLSNKYKNDFFQVLWLEDNQDLCIKETF